MPKLTPNNQPLPTQAVSSQPQVARQDAPIELKSPDQLFHQGTQDNSQVQAQGGTATSNVSLLDDPVSFEEIQWASQMEAAAASGTAIQPADKEKYWNIIERLAATELSQDELTWAENIENQAAQAQAQGQAFEPSAADAQRYQSIASKVGARRLVAQRDAAQPPQQTNQSAPAQAPTQNQAVSRPSGPVSAEDINWATQIEQARAGGQAISTEDDARFWNILERLAAEGVSPEEMELKTAIEQKHNSGQPISAEEQQKYVYIASKVGAEALISQRDAAQPGAANNAADALAQNAQQTGPSEQQNPVDAQMMEEKFNTLGTTLDNLKSFKYQSIMLDGATKAQMSEAFDNQLRTTAVQIWLDGSQEDRLKLAQTLVDKNQSDVLGRIMNHQETTPLEVARLMSDGKFPLKDFMADLDDNRAFLVLNAVAEVALTGESSSNMVLQEVATDYNNQYKGFWDREKPFIQLKNHLTAQGNWQKLPESFRSFVENKLLD